MQLNPHLNPRPINLPSRGQHHLKYSMVITFFPHTAPTHPNPSLILETARSRNILAGPLAETSTLIFQLDIQSYYWKAHFRIPIPQIDLCDTWLVKQHQGYILLSNRSFSDILYFLTLCLNYDSFIQGREIKSDGFQSVQCFLNNVTASGKIHQWILPVYTFKFPCLQVNCLTASHLPFHPFPAYSTPSFLLPAYPSSTIFSVPQCSLQYQLTWILTFV